MEKHLQGVTAFVGGASKGIGKATAINLAQAGARVVLAARSQDLLEQVRSELPTDNDHIVCAVDYFDSQQLKQKLKATLEQTGPIQILINNTGGPKAGPLLDVQEESMERAFRCHVVAAQIKAQLMVPGMIEKGWGRIVNVISTSVKIPINNLGLSNTIRGAMASWSKTLANELGPKNITVNNILPGYTATNRLDVLLANTSKKTGKSQDELRTEWQNKVPLRRFAQPEETAQAIEFLVSQKAAYISGVNIPVDGGRTGCL